MSYKDPSKQREAINQCLGCSKAIIQTEGKRQRLWCSDTCRIATKRRSEPITEQVNSEQTNTEHSITNNRKGMTVKNERSNEPSNVIPEEFPKTTRIPTHIRGKPKGGIMQDVRDELSLNPAPDKALPDVEIGGVDLDAMSSPKRGKDIKCFADLPADVQQKIDNTVLTINFMQYMEFARQHLFGTDFIQQE